VNATAAGTRSPFDRITKRTAKLLVAAAVVLVGLLIAVFAPPWTVKSLDDLNATSAVAGSENLDPAKYVDSIWEKKLLPTVQKSAIDLPTLLKELKANRQATVKKYGNIASLGGAPAFLVKGEGRIVSVDTASLISKAGVAFGAGKKPDVFMQIGPIVSGTDVRDALKFINFNQFINQVQYEEVSVAINSRIRETVLSKLDPAKLKGKAVRFAGAFTYTGPKNVVVMPVTLEVKGT
jgi:predicted lipoprotein